MLISPLNLGITMEQKLPLLSGITYGGSLKTTAPIAICCVCGLVRARKIVTAECDRWITGRAYEQRYGVSLVGNVLTHTYCSGCYSDFMQRVSTLATHGASRQPGHH